MHKTRFYKHIVFHGTIDANDQSFSYLHGFPFEQWKLLQPYVSGRTGSLYSFFMVIFFIESFIIVITRFLLGGSMLRTYECLFSHISCPKIVLFTISIQQTPFTITLSLKQRANYRICKNRTTLFIRTAFWLKWHFFA